MAQQKIQYKGHALVFDEESEPPLLMIDGQMVDVHVRASSHGKAFGAKVKGHSDYPALLDLAKALIDADLVVPPAGSPSN